MRTHTRKRSKIARRCKPSSSMRRRLSVVAGFLLSAAIFSASFVTASAQGSTAATIILRPHAEPKPVADLEFADGEGRAVKFSDFRGKVILVNVWATWCVPCRTEMPTLDRLQAQLGGADFEVVALSIDRAGAKAVTPFYLEIDVTRLKIYVGPAASVMRTLGVAGLPTTVLIDREGREVSRLVGPAEWDDPAIVETIRRYISSSRTDAGGSSTRHEGA